MTSFLIDPYRFGRAWTPADITTALWLDASDASTVTTVSGAVSEWRDKSGNARHLTQGTAASRPTYTTAGQNGLNVLTFDGSNDFLINSAVGLPVGASARTMVAVYKPSNTTTSGAICGQSNRSVNNAWFNLYFFTGGPNGDPYFAGYNADLTDNSAVVATAKIASMNYNGTAGALKRNGTTTATGNLSLNTTDNHFRAGQGADGFGYANMLLCEIVFLASSASTNTEQLIEGYLAHKWGLAGSLPAGHPYKSAAPTV